MKLNFEFNQDIEFDDDNIKVQMDMYQNLVIKNRLNILKEK